jgi:hypothetical protein
MLSARLTCKARGRCVNQVLLPKTTATQIALGADWLWRKPNVLTTDNGAVTTFRVEFGQDLIRTSYGIREFFQTVQSHTTCYSLLTTHVVNLARNRTQQSCD